MSAAGNQDHVDKFSSHGACLVPGTMRAFRSWAINVEVTDTGGHPTWADDLHLTTASLNELIHDVMIDKSDEGRANWAVSVNLLPVNSGYEPWRKTTVASCRTGDHDSPSPQAECLCGLYGWYRMDETLVEHTGPVVGVIEVSGRVIMGAKGLRAERAKIIAVTLSERYWPVSETRERRRLTTVLKNAFGRHGVEVFDTVNDLVRAYPPDLETLRNLIGEGAINDLVVPEVSMVGARCVGKIRWGPLSVIGYSGNAGRAANDKLKNLTKRMQQRWRA